MNPTPELIRDVLGRATHVEITGIDGTPGLPQRLGGHKIPSRGPWDIAFHYFFELYGPSSGERIEYWELTESEFDNGSFYLPNRKWKLRFLRQEFVPVNSEL